MTPPATDVYAYFPVEKLLVFLGPSGMHLQTLAKTFCLRLETVAPAYRPLNGELAALRGMKYGAVASCKGLSFSRAFFGMAEPKRISVDAQLSGAKGRH